MKSFFNEAFVKNFMKKTFIFLYKFPKFISGCSISQNIRISNLVILKRRLFECKAKWVFLTYFLRDFTKQISKIYKSVVIESFKLVSLCPIKWRAFKVFVKLNESSLLITNIVKGAVSGLRQFLATESP